jgi:hypothetical protein
MKNWSEYLQEISELLTAEPREAPGFRVLKQGPDQESAKQEGTAK